MPELLTCEICELAPHSTYRRFAYGVGLGHDARAHRIINTLWHGGVCDVGQFHEMAERDLRRVAGISDARVRLILERRTYPGDPRSPVGTLRRAAAAVAAMPEPWLRALGGAFEAAAENHVYCRRINHQRPRGVPQLPDPSAEELVGVARLLLTHHAPAPAGAAPADDQGEMR